MSEHGEHEHHRPAGARGSFQHGRPDPYEYDLDTSTRGRDLTGYQLELAAAPPIVYEPKGKPKAGPISQRPKTQISAMEGRLIRLDHVVRSNNPDGWPAAIKPADGTSAAILGGLVLGVPGAVIAGAASGLEFKWKDDYYTLASLPGHFMQWVEENSDIPFSKLPDMFKRESWDFLEFVAPEVAAALAWAIKIWKDDFDPHFTRFIPSEHWWQADKEVELKNFEVFGSAMDRSIGKGAVQQMNDETQAKFYDAVERLGMQFGGVPGQGSGLVGTNGNMSHLMQQIELAQLGHLVGDRLAGESIGSDGTIKNFSMYKLDKDGDKYLVTKDINIGNRDDLAEVAQSVFLGTKYAALKIGHHPGAPGGPAENPLEKEEKAQYRRSLSEKIAGMAAAAGITDTQLGDIMGLPKGHNGGKLYGFGLNKEIDPGHAHLQMEYRDPDGNVRRALVANEFTESKLEITAQQVEVVKTIKQMQAQHQDMATADMLHGVDFSEVTFKGAKDSDGSATTFTIDRDNPGITVDPDTLYVMANFTDGKKHKFMLDADDLSTLHDNVRKRDKLAALEHEIDSINDPVLLAAVVGTVDALTNTYHPGFSVTDKPKDGHHMLYGENEKHQPDRLDHVLTETEITATHKAVLQIKEHAQGAGGDAGGGKGGKKGGGGEGSGGDTGGDDGGTSGGGGSGGGGGGGASASSAEKEHTASGGSSIVNVSLRKILDVEGVEIESNNSAGVTAAPKELAPKEREGGTASSDDATPVAEGKGKLDSDAWARTAALLAAMKKGEELPELSSPEDAEPHRPKPGKTPGTDKTPGGWSLS